MKPFLALLPLLLSIPLLLSQISPLDFKDDGISLETDASRTYFLEVSENLYEWELEGEYKIGDGDIHQRAAAFQEAGYFYRYVYLPTNKNNPFDTDGDGLSNYEELNVLGEDFDPLNEDTNNNGLSDGDEVSSSSYDPSDLYGDADGDGPA